jgi:hypothetical protein
MRLGRTCALLRPYRYNSLDFDGFGLRRFVSVCFLVVYTLCNVYETIMNCYSTV